MANPSFNPIIQPRFVAIDSSVLATWSKDFYSEDPKTANQAKDLLKSIFSANWVPVICWHHFEELVRHHKEDVAAKRVAFLESFPFITWLPNSKLPTHLGSIVDVFDAEIQALISYPNLDAVKICEKVRQNLFSYGPPGKIETFSLWNNLRPLLIAKADREQEIASVMHAREITDGKTKVFELKNIQEPNSEIVQKLFLQQEADLVNELGSRGDPRLESPQILAHKFTAEVAANFEEIVNRGGQPLEGFLQQFDVPINDVNENTTVEELQRLALRRRLVRMTCERLGLEINQIWPIVKTSLIPSYFIQTEIRQARKSAEKASGSDLADDYLLGLAPYVDGIIVDKRTCEYLNQCSRRSGTIRDLVGFFSKASSYHDLASILV